MVSITDFDSVRVGSSPAAVTLKNKFCKFKTINYFCGMRKEEKRKKVAETLINEMFKIAGHNVIFKDIEGRQDNWYQQWTMTVEQNDKWKDWGVGYIRKELKMVKKLAEKEMSWFSLNYGLKLIDYENK
jgi:hypothetical protein